MAHSPASGYSLVEGYVPGIIGRIAQLHAEYYSRHWGFGSFFEAKVASEFADFVGRYDASRDGLWSLAGRGSLEGSIIIDASEPGAKGAHLRWFIVSADLRGKGFGRALIEAAVEHCRARQCSLVYLWTFEGLNAARHLYEDTGFSLVEERTGEQWGRKVKEQRFELLL